MTAEPIDWMHPPSQGWTYEQVKDLDLPFDWELVDGAIVVRGMTSQWHDTVRDELYFALRGARESPYAVNAERCVLVDEHNPPKPDVVVFDRTGLDFFSQECVPIESVALVVEVVSHGSRTDDRFRKPAMYAEAGVQFFWRVERGADEFPVVHEFHLDKDTGVYAPAPGGASHEGRLITRHPFPVELDLRAIFAD
ncbi:Uma2 family endonuclease [Streptomyces sp. HNM0575]|uniref:Uma2 family endonuclease n=1 Tax=Streptomyces sp. HNM0575 TaxID=2716338 RepID=UPI00145EED60|nr:Uma2 family endonuclease [Streptomyces sp. HNM0575]NLU75820.1 Uma2 family endonuclease [Streptomyces sp. HNM0575]